MNCSICGLDMAVTDYPLMQVYDWPRGHTRRQVMREDQAEYRRGVKLTHADVIMIRRELSHLAAGRVADLYNCSIALVYKIRSGEVWPGL